jgi:hypothetical protein
MARSAFRSRCLYREPSSSTSFASSTSYASRLKQRHFHGCSSYAALLAAAAGTRESAASSSHFTDTSFDTPGSCIVTP